MNHDDPSVYTIILNWNQPQMTMECLDSLTRSVYPNNTIVVVDNGSKDGSPEIIRSHYPNIKLLVMTENLGFCEGNNVGMRYALDQGADYLFLLNNDTVVAPDMLTRLVEACQEDTKAGMAGPTMYYHDEPNKIAAAGGIVDRSRARFWNRMDGVLDPINNDAPTEDVDFIVSCAVLARRETVLRIGLLDNRYFINGDDIDWGLKAIESGYKVLYVPNAKMWHKISAAMGNGSPATTYYITRNNFLIFGTHLQGWRRLHAQVLNTTRTMRTLLAWSIKPKYRNLKRHRSANLLALRDAYLGRFGKMGEDVASVCYQNRN
jgi:GT2 family glycosyltransferase